MLASERGITVIEVKEDKLMLTRNNDYIMVGSKFPRLTKKQAGARLKEIKHASRITHSASAYIPFRYIADARQRIEIYRKLAQATDQAGLRNLKQELRDRFGPLPPPLELLLRVAELRILASERGITVSRSRRIS